VTVRDTTAPALTVPGDVTAEATGHAGAVVHYGDATATDAVSTPAIIYSVPNDAVFPLGTTTVTVTATDEVGNETTASLTPTPPPPPGRAGAACPRRRPALAGPSPTPGRRWRRTPCRPWTSPTPGPAARCSHRAVPR